jgi:hypothetical protein
VNGNQPESNPDIQAWLATGYLCSRTEAGLESIRAAAGVSLTQQQLCQWVGEFFLSKARGALLDGAQHLSQMRGDAAEGYAFGAGPQALHVHPRNKRALSVEARAAISKAQRKRWRLARVAARGGRKESLKSFKPASRSHSIANARGQKTYWAGMTKEQRSKEMRRRVLVRQGKATSVDKRKLGPRTSARALPKGFWQQETKRLLAKGPVTRAELRSALLRAQPGKENAITVALAAMKREHFVSEVNQVFTLREASA